MTIDIVLIILSVFNACLCHFFYLTETFFHVAYTRNLYVILSVSTYGVLIHRDRYRFNYIVCLVTFYRGVVEVPGPACAWELCQYFWWLDNYEGVSRFVRPLVTCFYVLGIFIFVFINVVII